MSSVSSFNLDQSKFLSSVNGLTLPNDKILDSSHLTGFVDNKINLSQIFKFVFGRVENIVGKGENAVYQHFLFFPQCFQKASYEGLLKVVIVCGVNPLPDGKF